VLSARDPLTFLAGWELMTLLPAALILVGRADETARRTVFLYVAVTHLAGAGTWIAVLLAAHAGVLDGTHVLTRGSGLQIAIAVAALVGMGTKAGVMPLHSWLPRAHPIAPAPVSALMSGVMIKVAIYGLVRVLVDWLGVLPVWFGVLVLALGALSAVGGVVYALFQHDLKRLLAFHSIENVGIIVLGLGACLLLRARGADTWAALALAAALLHTLNHAVFKSLLFLGAGAFEHAVGSLEIDRLGGLLRRMPWTGGAFLVGSLAIAGVPPLNGFASEWLTLQALVHVPAYGGLGDGLAGAFSLAALAATAALAVFCFVKVVGLVLLGPPRRERVADAIEAPLPMRAAVVALASACVALGVVPGLLVASLARLAPWPVSIPTSLVLRLPGTGSLPTVGIALVLGLLVPALVMLRGRRVAAPAPTWACGQLVEPQLAWTSAGFTKPLRLVLEIVLRPQREIAVRTAGGVVQEVTYSGRVPQLIDERLYAPAVRSALVAARHARRLQTGHLGTYIGYLIALVLALLAAAKAGLIG
jgi:hydrogenase-4 component B